MYEFEDDGVDVTHRKYYSIGGTMVAKREWVRSWLPLVLLAAHWLLSICTRIQNIGSGKYPKVVIRIGGLGRKIPCCARMTVMILFIDWEAQNPGRPAGDA
jgi:hypothetical protein